MKQLIISLHDIHPESLHRVREQRETLKLWGVDKCSLLMVPQFHHRSKIAESANTIAWGTQAQLRGDELILHGYYHDRDGQTDALGQWFWTRFYSNREAEFYDLHEIKARQRLDRGQSLFQHLGWNLKGFIAPAWLMSAHMIHTLKEMGFTYTNTVRGVVSLKPEPVWRPARTLCWSVRAAWRREVSLIWNALLFRALIRQPVIRVSLHPQDLEFVTIRKQIAQHVKRALEAGFQPVTYASYVAR
jgi:predicted deacetylase